VKWHVAPELSKDKIRQLVGNCLGVIIFNDSRTLGVYLLLLHCSFQAEPIQPAQLFLGQITTTVVVIEPHVIATNSGKTETKYR
jgi:hypothetical protein